VQALFPSLAHAAGLVASPVIRNMATIGGNVNLDTRCRYVNQTSSGAGRSAAAA
jgi:CO/xanthine dehydrogenase FAD-binding subunit